MKEIKWFSGGTERAEVALSEISIILGLIPAFKKIICSWGNPIWVLRSFFNLLNSLVRKVK